MSFVARCGATSSDGLAPEAAAGQAHWLIGRMLATGISAVALKVASETRPRPGFA